MGTPKIFARSGSIGLFSLFLFISLVAWAFASPIGSTPDEDYHLASIWCGHGEQADLCSLSTDVDGAVVVPAALTEASGCYAFNPENSADCPLAPSDVTVTTLRSNTEGGYPPVFYWVMSLFASSNLVASIIAMRIFNALLFVTALFLTFRALPPNLRKPLLWGSIITLIPLGIFLIPSVNPSSWAITSAATLWVALTGYFKSSTLKARVTLGAMAIFSAFIGAGARSDAAVYAGIAIVVSIVLSTIEIKRDLKLLILPGALLLIAVAFFFSAGQSSALSPGSSESTSVAPSVGSLLITNIQHLPELWAGAMGTWGLGWLDTAMPGLVWVLSLGLYCALVFSGLAVMSWNKLLALLIIAAGLVVIPLYILMVGKIIVGSGVQPRYIFPLMVMVAGISISSVGKRNVNFTKLQSVVVLVGLVVAQSQALHSNLRRYLTGISGGGTNLDKAPDWWWEIPIGPMWVWALGTISFALAILGCLYLLRSENKVNETIAPIVSL